MHAAQRRSPHDGLTASEGEELTEASRTAERLHLPPVERYQQVAAEYAERCVIALTNNDLFAAMRAATISRAATHTVAAELRHQERAREMRERWEQAAEATKTRPRAITSTASLTRRSVAKTGA